MGGVGEPSVGARLPLAAIGGLRRVEGEILYLLLEIRVCHVCVLNF